MAISHTNRKGDVYYLHRGQTRSGRANYFFSKKQAGDLAETVPEGYEVYEKPSGQVFLRKAVPREVTDEEVGVVVEGLRRLAGLDVYRVDAEKDSIVVYLPDQSREDLEQVFSEFGGLARPGLVEEFQRRGSYSAMMRFVLSDKERRRFSVERWCFKGSIDDWFPLWDGHGDLAELVARYVPYLGKESFFDLM